MEKSIVKEIPFHSLIVGSTGSGKTKYLIDLLRGPFKNVFRYIILICPTYSVNDTWENFANGDKRFFVMSPNTGEIDECLEICHDLFHDNKMYEVLVILDDCAVSSDVKKRTSKLIDLAFSGRHINISVWVITQKLTSISSSFRENVKFIVSFFNNNRDAEDMLYKEYGSRIDKDERNAINQILEEHDYSRIVFFKKKYEVQIPNTIF